ncbi:unnamed protein product [Linum trigynum]|uniref:Uncharacterized protein n=1 Tax=Linum trigynum TaxID=586398 RepID=A0AAV2F721_9ROSI
MLFQSRRSFWSENRLILGLQQFTRPSLKLTRPCEGVTRPCELSTFFTRPKVQLARPCGLAWPGRAADTGKTFCGTAVWRSALAVSALAEYGTAK